MVFSHHSFTIIKTRDALDRFIFKYNTLKYTTEAHVFLETFHNFPERQNPTPSLLVPLMLHSAQSARSQHFVNHSKNPSMSRWEGKSNLLKSHNSAPQPYGYHPALDPNLAVQHCSCATMEHWQRLLFLGTNVCGYVVPCACVCKTTARDSCCQHVLRC